MVSRLAILNALWAVWTSNAVSHDAGAILAYHGQVVSLLWQSPQARVHSSCVATESHCTGVVIGVPACDTGTSCAAARTTRVTATAGSALLPPSPPGGRAPCAACAPGCPEGPPCAGTPKTPEL